MLALPFKRQAPADRYTVWILAVLAAVGVVAVYSAVSFLAQTKGDGDAGRFLAKHVGRMAMAFGAMAMMSLVSYRTVARWSLPLLLGSWGLLVLVQLVGVVSGGAARWLRFGELGFQPSDIAKVALLAYLAVLIAKKQTYVKEFGRAFVPVFGYVLVTCALIGMQNLSTAALLLATCMVVCFVGRVSTWHLGGFVGVGLALATLMLALSPARAARVENYVGIELFGHTQAQGVGDDRAENYQAHQAEIAFAMGGAFGVGPGKSVQRDFLPAPYNDFIFAIIGEEYGLMGTLGLLALFCALLFRGFLRIARYAPDPLGLFMAVGLTTSIVIYGFVHAGVTCGLLPVTGLPMPFVSYGGSSLIVTGAMAGILLNISREAAPASKTEEAA